ncbi:MAG: HEAT repeat domain-containing protein [Anaerolineae bacterium]|jgi:HEAT repeat protein
MFSEIDLAPTTASADEPSIDDMEDLIQDLGDRDVTTRKDARRMLQRLGRAATPALTEALKDPKEHVRWEAMQALRCIEDPRAAPALIQAMDDSEPAVRWLAARALVALGRDALEPVLLELEQGTNDAWIRTGVHHVLHALLEKGAVDSEEVEPVLEALENLEPRVEAPVAAYHALRKLRGESS